MTALITKNQTFVFKLFFRIEMCFFKTKKEVEILRRLNAVLALRCYRFTDHLVAPPSIFGSNEKSKPIVQGFCMWKYFDMTRAKSGKLN